MELTEPDPMACDGEIFVAGEGIWGHTSGSVDGPIPTEPGGTVELTLKSARGKERSLPAAFVGHVSRKTGSQARVDRVLCREVAGEEPLVDGTYACTVPAGTTAIKLSFDGFGTAFVWDLSVSEGEEDRAHARLLPGVRLSGWVETPEVSARLFPRGLERSKGSMELASVVRELPEGGAFLVEDVAPGAYVYRLEGTSGASSQVDVVVPTSVRQVELPRLRPPVRVEVRVQMSPRVDGAGKGWGLTLLPRSDSGGTGGARSRQADGPIRSRGRQAQIWTDEAGRFEIRGIEPGQVEVGAVLRDPPCESSWRTMSLREGADAQPIELVLEEKSPITVRVTAAGQPVGGARVIAFVDAGLSKRGVTGPGGVLSLELARRRSGTLIVLAPGYGAVLQGFDAGVPGSTGRKVAVSLVPAAGDLALTQLRADAFDRGWLSSDRHGVVPLRLLPSLLSGGISFGESITISGLSPGSYEFCVGERSCWSTTVFPDARTEIDLSEE